MRHGRLDPAPLQQMLYDALEHSDDIVLVLEQIDEGTEGIVVAAANDAFCRTSGYSQLEIIGQPLHALAAPAADPGSYADIVQAVHDNLSLRSEILCNRQSGVPFWLGLHLMPVHGTTAPYFVVLGRDITDSLQARQQQAAVQGLLAKVFLCVQAPVAIVSDDGVIQMTNPALDRLLGYPPGGLTGKRAIDYNAPSALPAIIAAGQKQVENGQDYTIATSLLRANGTGVAVELTSITVQRDDLRHFRIVTVLELACGEPPVTIHVAGKIKLIGLQEVKEALGSRWAEVAARAMASAEHVIRRRCGPHDTCSRTQDGGFLICFGDATEDEAAFRAATIAREIRARLIGEGETGSTAQVSAIAAAVEVPNQPGQSADMLAAIIGERLNGRLAEIETRARETLRKAVHAATCELEPVRGRRSNEPVAHFAKLPRELEWRIQTAYCALSVVERQEFDFDRLVLGVAAEQAIANLGAGRTMLILVNVEFDVFLDRRCMGRYLAACQALDPRLREHLMLVLSGMPRGCPQSRVLECVTRLRPFCRGVGFQSETLEPPAVDLSIFGSPIVVLQENDLNLRNANDMAKLAKLVENLHNHQARVLVRQVHDWETAKQLGRLGVDLVSVMPGKCDAESGTSHPHAADKEQSSFAPAVETA